jgi:AI-2 transport system substrate-binding protein
MQELPKFKCLVALAFLAVLFAFGCNNEKTASVDDAKSESAVKMVLVPKVTGNAFFEAANEGAQKYAAKHGFIVDYQGSEIASVDKQIEIIKKAIDDKVQAIVISSLDYTALDAELKRAKKQGIIVVTWDSDVSGDARQLMVSQGTPSQLGQLLVEMASKSLSQRNRNPATESIKYAWHYSQASVADQNSWWKAGEDFIRTTYPNWVNVAPENYYSEQDPQKALEVGKLIFQQHPDIDLIICNDSTSLPGQALAVKELGLTASDVTVTGFASPNAIKQFCLDGLITRWGLWDCQTQAALACYLAWYLASGNTFAIGQLIEVPEIGLIEVMPNTVLDPAATNHPDSGVVLLPARTEFTAENMDQYNF